MTQGYQYDTTVLTVLCTDVNVSGTLEDFGGVSEKTALTSFIFLRKDENPIQETHFEQIHNLY